MAAIKQRTVSSKYAATSHPYAKTNGEVHLADAGALKKHLTDVARDINARWVLVHADDGVCWGKLAGEAILFSYDQEQSDTPYSAQIRPSTLQECRIFGEGAEYFMWRTDALTFADRLIEDQKASDAKEDWVKSATWTESIDEDYWLWGRYAKEQRGNFTLLHEGRQGLEHVVPWLLESENLQTKLPKNKTRPRPLCLRVRHYLNRFDPAHPDTADAFIETSRLVKLHHPEQKP